MRLWHINLVLYLPRQQLLAQWRECMCIAKSLAQKGTPNHVLVNRILDYPASHFEKYGLLVMDEMNRRGYKVTRERKLRFLNYIERWAEDRNTAAYMGERVFAYWHTSRYLVQCLTNLQEKHDCGAIPDGEWKIITSEFGFIFAVHALD